MKRRNVRSLLRRVLFWAVLVPSPLWLYFGWRNGYDAYLRACVHDAVHVVALHVHSAVRDGDLDATKPERVDALVARLRRESVIDQGARESGGLDPWGGHFQVRAEQTTGGLTVTCTSPGRDGVLGTADDISKTVGE